MQLPLTVKEQHHVALITYCATILADVVGETDKREGARKNRLSRALENIRSADRTFHGYIPNAAQIEAMYAKFDDIINDTLGMTGEETEVE
jgi:hypothetical protein